MTYPKAIFFSSVIIAAAIIFASVSPVSSQSRGGYFTISGDSGQFVWRINMSTGALDYCVRRDNSVDPVIMEKRPPYCSASTPPLK